MQPKNGITRRAVLLMLVILGLGIIASLIGDYLLIHGFVFFGTREVSRCRTRLLSETDHKALLDACRELLKRVAEGQLASGTYHIRKDREPEVSKFPRVILDLEPNYIYIDDNYGGRVTVEMFGGFSHLGVNAYAEDYKKPSWLEYGDRELIDGLWYYDEGYEYNSEYDKTIDALIDKNKQGEVDSK